jgi:hypothetical protein
MAMTGPAGRFSAGRPLCERTGAPLCDPRRAPRPCISFGHGGLRQLWQTQNPTPAARATSWKA